jgi:hypothetical protein
MKTCPYCQQSNPNGAVFCSVCKRDFPLSQGLQPSQRKIWQWRISPSDSLLWLAGSGFVLCLGVFLAALWVFKPIYVSQVKRFKTYIRFDAAPVYSRPGEKTAQRLPAFTPVEVNLAQERLGYLRTFQGKWLNKNDLYLDPEDPELRNHLLWYRVVNAKEKVHYLFRRQLPNGREAMYTESRFPVKQVTFQVVTSPLLRAEKLQPLVRKAVSELRAADPDLDEMIIQLYSDEGLLLSGATPDIGQVIWGPEGRLYALTPLEARNNQHRRNAFRIEARAGWEEYLQARSQAEERFGMTEEERRVLFKAIVTADLQAQAVANERYPLDISGSRLERNIERNYTLRKSLEKTYREKLREQRALSQKQWDSILEEARRENWLAE